MQKISMKNWSSDAVLGAPENAPYRRKIPHLGLKFREKKKRHNLWALRWKSRKKSAKKWNSDVVLGVPDSASHGGKIPHLGFRFQNQKWHIRVLPLKACPCKNENETRRETKKSAKTFIYTLVHGKPN
jgi:hypothetical protein